MISRVALEQPVTLRPAPGNARPVESGPTRFADVLTETMRASGPVRISAHAAQRLEARGVQLTADSLARIGEALDQLAGKGGKEALVLLGDVALVASIPNRTIITAVAAGDDQTSLFTNIDSAAVLPSGKADEILNRNQRPDPSWEARAPRNDRRGAMT